MKIIAVTNDRMDNRKLVDTLLAIESSIDAVILREKSKTDSDVIALIRQLLDSGFNPAKIIGHGQPSVASSTGITSVQLPGNCEPFFRQNNHFPNLSFGRSVHSLDEAELATQAGASWVLYGHLFTTDSKQGLPARGTDELFQIAKSLPIPVYAIGGIQPHHLSQLTSRGVAGVAIMSSIFGSDDPEAAARAYKNAIK